MTLLATLSTAGQLTIDLAAPTAAFWAVYNYRKNRRTEAARWVKGLYEELYTEPELVKARELIEYDYEEELRYLFEIRVTDRHIKLNDRLRENLRLVDRLLNFFEQIIYLEDEGNFTEHDRNVFFEYWFGELAHSARSGLHRYLARCGYERLAKAIGAHKRDYVVFYGTLMSSYGNLERLKVRNMIEFVSKCKVPGQLVDLGEWPGAIREDGHFNAELWRVKDYQVFRILDPFERYDAHYPDISYYERRTVRLIDPRKIDAWIYYLRDPKPEEKRFIIESGSWEEYVQGRNALTGIVRELQPGDASAVYELSAKLTPLIQHTPYTYWLLCNYANHRSFVAERDGELVGFVTSLLSDSDPPVLFVWQVGVITELRGTGLSDRLLDRVAEAARQAGATAIEATIEQDNPASRKAFERLADRLNSELTEVRRVSIPSADAKGSAEEILYRIDATGAPQDLGQARP